MDASRIVSEADNCASTSSALAAILTRLSVPSRTALIFSAIVKLQCYMDQYICEFRPTLVIFHLECDVLLVRFKKVNRFTPVFCFPP